MVRPLFVCVCDTATIVMLKLAVAVFDRLSVTCTIIGYTPTAKVVPVIKPPGLRKYPGGSTPLPLASDHVYGPVPPDAANGGAEYGMPVKPFGRLVVVTVNPAPATMVTT